MAKRSNTTFIKRQKEMARKQKRQEKLERRLERKKLKESGEATEFGEIDFDFDPDADLAAEPAAADEDDAADDDDDDDEESAAP